MIDPKDLPKTNDNPNVRVLSIRYFLQCKTCEHKYVVALQADGKLPYQWDYCMACASKRKQVTREYFDTLNKGGEPIQPDFVKGTYDNGHQ